MKLNIQTLTDLQLDDILDHALAILNIFDKNCPNRNVWKDINDTDAPIIQLRQVITDVFAEVISRAKNGIKVPAD